MPRFYFHIYNDIVTLDEEGLELPDREAAREQAIFAGRELLCDQVREGRVRLHHRIEVADDKGRVVLKVPFRELVEIEG